MTSESSTTARPFLRTFRRGAVALYATTLFVSIIVVAGGVSLVTLQRASRGLHDNIESSEQAYLIARSGLEWTLTYVDSEPDWRAFVQNGASTTLDVGDLGSFTVMIVDADGNLTDNDADAVGLRVTCDVNRSRRGFELSAEPQPHPVLEYALFSDTGIFFHDADDLHGPAYAQDYVWADNYVDTYDNGSFATPRGGFIDWWLDPQDENSEPVEKPVIDLDFFVGMGTFVQAGKDNNKLENANLTPVDSSEGTPNSLGVYYVDVGGNNLEVKKTHVKGTLIILGDGGNKVEIRDGCWFESAGNPYPTLIVSVPGGEIIIDMSGHLDEHTGDYDRDFNEDGDTIDAFDFTLSGLVWTDSGDLELKGAGRPFSGCLIANYIELKKGVVVDDDPGLSATLMPQFTDGDLHVSTGSVREVTP